MQRVPIPDQGYLHLLDSISFQPIFIMGDHRSGTTLFYQLLDRTKRFNVVRAYHLVEFEQLLANQIEGREAARKEKMAQYLRLAGMQDRALDQVAVGPDLPEEYGFILDDSRRPRLMPENLPRLRQLGQKIQYLSREQRPLVLKNPWDFTNFLYIAETFPTAKFIFLHRHPLDVINSQIEAARTLYKARSAYHALLDPGYGRIWHRPLQLATVRLLFSTRFGLGRRVTLRHVSRSIDGYNRNIAALPRQRIIEIRFEDLLRDATATIGKVLADLGMEGIGHTDLQQFIRTRPPHRLPEVESRRAAIVDRFGQYCQKWGYT